MNYVFFGGQESLFAQIILDRLVAAGKAPIASIRDARKPLDINYLQSLKADFFLVAAFAKILKPEVLSIPVKGAIGAHPSLLPKYRGPSPIQSAILNGEIETGTTIFLIDEKVDHGSILASSAVAINQQDTYETLLKKLADLSAETLLAILPKWLAGQIAPAAQDESVATYTKKFLTADAEVNLKKDSPRKIWLMVKAMNPEPGVFTVLTLKNGKQLRLKILQANLIGDQLQPRLVQPEGKKPMPYQDFLNGYRKLIETI